MLDTGEKIINIDRIIIVTKAGNDGSYFIIYSKTHQIVMADKELPRKNLVELLNVTELDDDYDYGL